MTAAYQKGASALLKYGSQSSPESYTTVGGLRNVDLSIDGSPVDVTNKDSAGYQKMLAGAGVWKADITAQGLFDNTTAIKALMLSAMPPQFEWAGQVIFGNGDTFTGNWVIRTMKRTGNYNDAETYDFSITSSGTIAFVAG